MSAPRITVAWAGLCAAALLTMSGCATPGGADGLAAEDPPVVLPTADPTPTPTPTPDSAAGGGYAECDDASPAALAAVNASIAAHDGPFPGLRLDGLETRWDDEQQVWTLAGTIGPVGDDPDGGPVSDDRVALWATDRDPTREDFAGTLWSAVNGADMVSDAPQLGSFPQLTMDGPVPAGMWCSDLYPAAAGGTGG
ncbi:hypothetical protein PSS89_01585 [Clavibacter michiganensis subsp. michiganensis]|uniref:hypothetical protein n=1 Tax=Clavibacter michiganensis TaxID=28447 RepID=UPI001D0AEBDA|nr:hypothetical protein [Clavibacter michiganensis]UDM10948.1 hypothetical protein LHJ49_01600 [Clavibacter michiganensis subsp. michiganensis]WDD25644.1 hypothetical protein PSI72_01580 [Clavibacter michiganensis subsp. michiganensis]WDD28756.1 hypothetical protein PSS89_01585 [Clavibacter michiganensis subsp. michiganensis]